LHILCEDLALQKVNLWRVPHTLDSAQKQNHVTFSRAPRSGMSRATK
jgi:hypothetical protein